MNLNRISKRSYKVIIENESSIREHSNGIGNLIMNQRSRSSHERESTLTERAEYMYLKQQMQTRQKT